MKRTILLLLILSAGCAITGPETQDNPHITPTSKTGVTSTKGTSVYEKIPETPAPAQR